MLVCGKVVGQALRLAHAGADQAVASHVFQVPVPEHVVVSEELHDDPHRRMDRKQ